MTNENKQSIIIRYNALLEKLFAAMTITETNAIQVEMDRVFWNEVCRPGYRFVWSPTNRVEDIVPRSA